jgi:hypothetical protein
MIILDTETVGLTGPIVLIQYAIDDGDIVLYNPWHNTIKETKLLLERIANHPGGICGFNLAFDSFKICQMYTTLLLLPEEEILNNLILEYAILERDARDGPCWKPTKALDLMLYARKGKFQSLMGRKDIKVNKVPTPLAGELCRELNRKVKLDPIYFSKKKIKTSQWQIFDRKDEPEFKDIVMKFNASTALKSLAKYVLKLEDEEIIRYHDISVDKQYMPKEVGFAPYALALTKYNNKSTEWLMEHKYDIDWNSSIKVNNQKTTKTWPLVIQYHIAHWLTNKLARKYAAGDVDKTRKLYEYFKQDEPNLSPGDDDSELACMVGACRWRGYGINLDGIRKLKKEAQEKIGTVPTAPEAVRTWIMEKLDRTEIIASDLDIETTTKKILLEKISQLYKICTRCKGNREILCDCENGKIIHPAAERAQDVLDARKSAYNIRLYNKFLLAGRLHSDFDVIGAKSSRMSGAGGLNTQGINKAYNIRQCFTLALSPMQLDGGDFSSFEVVIAIAVWGDKKLEETVTSYRTCHRCGGKGKLPQKKKSESPVRYVGGDGSEHQLNQEDSRIQRIETKGNEHKEEIICETCGGKGKSKIKIHALFGTYVYKGKTYEEIVDSDGSKIFDYYTRAKSGLFSQMYGGTEYTLMMRLGIPEEEAKAGMELFLREYPDVAIAFNKIKSKFQSMVQKKLYGKIEWKEPADYTEEPILGHRRYFTLENKVCKALYDLAQNVPDKWKDLKIKTYRRDRDQWVAGAVQSALFACAFKMQSANVRAAINHNIQAAGAKITKYVQRKVWDIQPSGIHPFRVMPMNIHDELEIPCLPEFSETVKQTVIDAVEHFRKQVPLIEIKWHQNIPNWAGKKG